MPVQTFQPLGFKLPLYFICDGRQVPVDPEVYGTEDEFYHYLLFDTEWVHLCIDTIPEQFASIAQEYKRITGENIDAESDEKSKSRKSHANDLGRF